MDGENPGAITTTKTERPWLAPPWKPGQSGNPAGRPRKPLSEKLLAQLMKEDEQGVASVVQALLGHAHNTDPKVAGASVKAITEIFDRVEGKVPQAVSGPDGGPIELLVVDVAVGGK